MEQIEFITTQFNQILMAAQYSSVCFNLLFSVIYPMFFFIKDLKLPEEERKKQIIHLLQCTFFSYVLWSIKGIQNMKGVSQVVPLICEGIFSLVLVCLFIFEDFYKRLYERIERWHNFSSKELNVSKQLKNFRGTVANEDLQIEQIQIFQDLVQNEEEKEFESTPKVSKVEIRNNEIVDSSLSANCWRSHAQVAMVDKDELKAIRDGEVQQKPEGKMIDYLKPQFYILGGATANSIGEYKASDEISILDNHQLKISQQQEKGVSKVRMLEKRFMHRICFVDKFKIMAIGGHNGEETLKSCEIINVQLKSHKEFVEKPYQVKDMHIARQNFGCTILKDKQAQIEKNALKLNAEDTDVDEIDTQHYFKVVVVGGWSGRSQINSVEIFEFKDGLKEGCGEWSIQKCAKECLLKASYLGCGAFLDFDKGETDEKLVIFGGQTFSSQATEKMESAVEKNNSQVDAESVQNHIQELQEKKRNGELNDIEVAYLAKQEGERTDDDEKEADQVDNDSLVELKPARRLTYLVYSLNEDVKAEEKIQVCFDNKDNLDSEVQHTEIILDEVDQSKQLYHIKLDDFKDFYLYKKPNGTVGWIKKSTPPSANDEFIWKVDSEEGLITNIDQNSKQTWLSWHDNKLSLSETHNETCAFEVRQVEEDVERLDVTEILNMEQLMKREDAFAKKKGPGQVKTFRKKDLIDCPELNHQVDHVLNGTMFQVSRDGYWMASADFFIKQNTTMNAWNFSKALKEMKYQGGSVAIWFDDGYD